MTTFEKVSILNRAFNNQQGTVANPDWVAIEKQAKLCLEEAREMLEAVEARDMVALMDAQGDLTTVNDGVAYIAGFDGNDVYDAVHESNMSKFIRNEDEIAPALQYYYDKGFKREDLRLDGKLPQMCIKVARTVVMDGKEYPAGKFLKNMQTFREPNFDFVKVN